MLNNGIDMVNTHVALLMQTGQNCTGLSRVGVRMELKMSETCIRGGGEVGRSGHLGFSQGSTSDFPRVVSLQFYRNGTSVFVQGVVSQHFYPNIDVFGKMFEYLEPVSFHMI